MRTSIDGVDIRGADAAAFDGNVNVAVFKLLELELQRESDGAIE